MTKGDKLNMPSAYSYSKMIVNSYLNKTKTIEANKDKW